MSRIYVCEDCIEDAALQEVVRQKAVSEKCDYCGRESETPIACEFDDVIERMRFAIEQEYNDPASELPYDGREGGYQGNVLEGGYDLFDSIGFSVENEALFEDLCDAFSDENFCHRDYFGPTPQEYFDSAWSRFSYVVQHQRRYTFWNSLDEGEFDDPARHVTPGEMLEEIARNIQRVAPLVTIPIGMKMWRVRVHDTGKALATPKEFTSPPIGKATQPNRMSPAGISMFYGTEEFETAYVETVDPGSMKGKVATGVQFETLVPLNLLDLTAIRRPRSFFVDWDRAKRHAVEFAEAFMNDLSRPIKRDGRQHIEYVPTQVFTEYVRYEMETPDGEPFHGIKYRSSRNRESCFVIFADQDDCSSGGQDRPRPQMLHFVSGSPHTFRPNNHEKK